MSVRAVLSRRVGALLVAVLLVTLVVVSSSAQTPPADGTPPPATGQPAPQSAPPTTPPGPQSQPPAPPAPPPALAPDLAAQISKLLATVESTEKSITRMKDYEGDLGRLRDDVEQVIWQSTEVADRLRPRLTAVQGSLERLGKPPAKDAPPEAANVAAERARLTSEASQLDGAIKTLELTWYRARQMIDQITELRLTMFRKSLMERTSSPLLPALWRDIVTEAPQVGRIVSYVLGDWWSSLRRSAWLLALLIAAAIALHVVLRNLIKRLTRESRERRRARSFFEKAARIAWVTPVRALPGMATTLAVYAGLDVAGLLYYPSEAIAAAVVRAVLLYQAVRALIRGVLAPSDEEIRIVPLATPPARRLTKLLTAITAVFAIDLALTTIGRVLYLPLAMSVLQTLLMTVTFAALLAALLLTPFLRAGEGNGEAAAVARHQPLWLKAPLWGVVGAILLASVTGYLALGRFVVQQLIATGVVAAVAVLLFLAIRAFTRDQDETRPVGRMLEARFGLDPPRRQQIVKLAEVALTLTLGILALPLLLLQWGFSAADIRDWVKAAVFGFEVGQFRISLARILIGIVLFTALLFATRLFQRWMRENVLVAPRVDPGIANSIDTAVGYIGIALAALLAVSYAGFDITNLAIVAGALSLGIGFGLQSIVNNFVSGLILLIERPVKVGDWIVVGTEQGLVKRISVRATEIETFDKASLIVPNSELITGRVFNWTHRNMLGRIVIKIGVAYTADPEKVIAILLEQAKAHRDVLTQPAPVAAFDDFGASALQFSLMAHVGDVMTRQRVQTALRVAIFKALKEAGIEIPYNQMDVHMRDLDTVKKIAAEVLQERARTAAARANASEPAEPGGTAPKPLGA